MKLLITCTLFLALTLAGFNAKPAEGNKKQTISFDEQKRLVALGQLWGFLKYHHPEVAKGSYDWDKELIKRIPQIMKVESETEWKTILNNWVDSLPAISTNPDKKLPDRKIKLKPDYGELFNPEYFLPETIEKIKFILDNATITENHYIKVDPDSGLMTIMNEDTYSDLLTTYLPMRLLALFKHWNLVNYFFPYRDMCDLKWSEVLPEMLPEFIYSEDMGQYISACRKLVAKINDSHGFFMMDNNILNLKIGFLKVPFEVSFVEDKLTVIMYSGNDTKVKEKIKIGDIITAINGESVEDIVKRMSPYISASNNAVMQREIAKTILRGNETSVNITLQRDRDPFSVVVSRYSSEQLNIPNFSNPHPDSEGYRILDNNIGYVLPSSCKYEDRLAGIDKVLDGTKGLIVDFRCYPNDYISLQFLERLNHSQKNFSLVSYANISFPGYFFIINPQNIPNPNKDHPDYYKNKIVVIVNEYTQSSAEDNVLGFQLADNVIVIGSTTAGADGKVTFLNLPCGIKSYMTGLGVYYPDGSNLQRNGVKIDEVIKPTISGIREGRDELLERAIEIIEAN